MTNKQIVKSLLSQGVDVDFYVRKDGSIRVTRLNGVRYSSRESKGNEAARLLLFEKQGKEAKEASRLVQEELKPIKAQRIAAQRVRASGETLKKQALNFQEDFSRLQRLVKGLSKANLKQGKRGFDSITWAKTKEVAARLGISPEEQLYRMLDYYAPLSSDKAPRVMVQALISTIDLVLPRYPFLSDIRDYLNANMENQDIYALDFAGQVIYEITGTQNKDPKKEEKAAELLAFLKEREHR